jgi:hypothetical protein
VAANVLNIYEHERGWTDDGSARSVYVESGASEIDKGNNNMNVSRVFHDTLLPSDYVSGSALPYTMSFKLARAPQGAERVYGPVTLNVKAGYTTLKFKTRQMSIKIQETVASDWGLGNTRLRVQPIGGGR